MGGPDAGSTAQCEHCGPVAWKEAMRKETDARLSVKFCSGEDVCLDVHDDDTVAHVIRLVAKLRGVQPKQITLLADSLALHPSQCMSDIGGAQVLAVVSQLIPRLVTTGWVRIKDSGT